MNRKNPDPISPDVVPRTPGRARDLVMVLAVDHIIPHISTIEDRETKQLYGWTRDALNGLLHFLFAKIHDNTDNFGQNGLPLQFEGQPASLVLLDAWITQFSGHASTAPRIDWKEGRSIEDMLMPLYNEAKKFGYPAAENLRMTAGNSNNNVMIMYLIQQHLRRYIAGLSHKEISVCDTNDRLDQLENAMVTTGDGKAQRDAMETLGNRLDNLEGLKTLDAMKAIETRLDNLEASNDDTRITELENAMDKIAKFLDEVRKSPKPKPKTARKPVSKPARKPVSKPARKTRK